MIGLPTPYRCQGECGVTEVCSDTIYTNGLCLKPDKRTYGLQKEAERIEEDLRERTAQTPKK